MKGRGKHKKTMKDALVGEFIECRNSREEDLHSLPCSFSFRAWVTVPVIVSGHVAFITWPTQSDNFIGYSGWRKTVSSFTAETDTFHLSKNL
jgi:hypothetical protein